MAKYSFLTIWEIEAPIEQVWDVLNHSEQWPNWWKAVESVIEIAPGEPSFIGNTRRFTWKTPLAYKLAFNTRITRIQSPQLLELVANG